jgi:2-keto-4-pentenoate hydratase
VLQESNDHIAEIFVAARRSGRAIDAFPGKVPETLSAAYHVQEAAIAQFAEKIIGWKVGRIFPPLSEQFGKDRLCGPIFENAVQSAHNATGLIYDGGFGAAEAEFLLRIGTAPEAGKVKFTLDEAAALIDSVHVGIEIASSPLASINALGPPVIISDFGNNNGLIMGDEIPAWRTSGFADWTVTTRIDGVEVGSGKASAFPDGPIGAVRFLLETLAARGIATPAGTWISTGAVSGVHTVEIGQQVEACFGDGYVVKCAIGAMAKQ